MFYSVVLFCWVLFCLSYLPHSESDSVHACQVWLADLIPPDSNLDKLHHRWGNVIPLPPQSLILSFSWVLDELITNWADNQRSIERRGERVLRKRKQIPRKRDIEDKCVLSFHHCLSPDVLSCRRNAHCMKCIHLSCFSHEYLRFPFFKHWLTCSVCCHTFLFSLPLSLHVGGCSAAGCLG